MNKKQVHVNWEECRIVAFVRTHSFVLLEEVYRRIFAEYYRIFTEHEQRKLLVTLYIIRLKYTERCIG